MIYACASTCTKEDMKNKSSSQKHKSFCCPTCILHVSVSSFYVCKDTDYKAFLQTIKGFITLDKEKKEMSMYHREADSVNRKINLHS